MILPSKELYMKIIGINSLKSDVFKDGIIECYRLYLNNYTIIMSIFYESKVNKGELDNEQSNG